MNKYKDYTGFPIDFVMPWVDGSDPLWQAEKRKYLEEDIASSDSRDSRYRDWDLLKYWFRGVEAFAPWVNRIFFITCGQVPDWMNLNAPKLVHVNHADYMPHDYLPTFSANPIELNMHRIAGLSEHFVFFNDDFFFLQDVNPETFFRYGLPVYPCSLRPISARPGSIGMANIYLNDMFIINKRFKINEILRDKRKWYSLRTHSVKGTIYNYIFSHFENCVGFGNPHVGVPLLKSTIELLWKEEHDILDATSRRKFRDSRDVNQYVFRYWQYATNQFVSEKSSKLGAYFEIKDNNDAICRAIREKRYPQICLNDMGLVSDAYMLEKIKKEFISSFESILPQKSEYEK